MKGGAGGVPETKVDNAPTHEGAFEEGEPASGEKTTLVGVVDFDFARSVPVWAERY